MAVALILAGAFLYSKSSSAVDGERADCHEALMRYGPRVACGWRIGNHLCLWGPGGGINDYKDVSIDWKATIEAGAMPLVVLERYAFCDEDGGARYAASASEHTSSAGVDGVPDISEHETGVVYSPVHVRHRLSGGKAMPVQGFEICMQMLLRYKDMTTYCLPPSRRPAPANPAPLAVAAPPGGGGPPG